MHSFGFHRSKPVFISTSLCTWSKGGGVYSAHREEEVGRVGSPQVPSAKSGPESCSIAGSASLPEVTFAVGHVRIPPDIFSLKPLVTP